MVYEIGREWMGPVLAMNEGANSISPPIEGVWK